MPLIYLGCLSLPIPSRSPPSHTTLLPHLCLLGPPPPRLIVEEEKATSGSPIRATQDPALLKFYSDRQIEAEKKHHFIVKQLLLNRELSVMICYVLDNCLQCRLTL